MGSKIGKGLFELVKSVDGNAALLKGGELNEELNKLHLNVIRQTLNITNQCYQVSLRKEHGKSETNAMVEFWEKEVVASLESLGIFYSDLNPKSQQQAQELKQFFTETIMRWYHTKNCPPPNLAEMSWFGIGLDHLLPSEYKN